MTTHWNTDAAAPAVQQDGSQDPRFVKAKPDRKNPFDFGPGANHLFLLPSCSNYEEVLSSGQKYSWGWPYIQIKIRKDGDKYAQDLRVPNQNPLTKAFFDLYRAFGWGPKLKAIKDGGFNAGPDYRYAFNVAMLANGELSPLRIVRAGMRNPYKNETGDGAKPKLREQLIQAVTDGSEKVYARTQNRVFPADLKTAVLVEVQVQFNGTFPQYLTVLPARDQTDSVIVQDISEAIPGFELAQLDGAREWAETMDPLPELSEIPILYEDGQVCEVLRISSDRVAANPSSVAVSAQAPAPARGPAVPVPAASPIMPNMTKGFGNPAPAQPPKAAAAAPATPAAPAVPAAGPALPGAPAAKKAGSFSTMGSSAAEDFARRLQDEQSGAGGKQAPF